jgi:hypothetical protein
MSETIDRGTLDRLIARGQATGALAADDLRAVLPVERMEVDDLVLVMLELEAAGISVEPEAFGPPTDRPVSTALTLPARDPGVPSPIRRTEGAGTASSGARDPAPVQAAGPARAPDEADGATQAVVLAGLATLLILGAVLLML